MYSILSKILPWHKLGLPKGYAGTLPDLQAWYGDSWPALSKYFLPTDRLTSTIECPKPGGLGCPRQVVEHSFDDIVAVCGNSPQECEPVNLTRHDLIIHELKFEKLLVDFAGSLKIKGTAPEHVMLLTWELGSYAAQGRPLIPVYISFQSDPDELQAVTNTLLTQKEKPFLFLVTSRNICPVSLADTIQKAGVHLAGIDDLQSEQETTSGGDILGKCVYLENKGTDENNYFSLEKDYWQIRFRGVSYSIKQSVGMQYISHLIQRAYNDEPEIHVANLYYLVHKRPAVEDTELNKLNREQLAEIGFDVSGLGNAGDMMSPEGKKWIKTQVQKINDQIEEEEEYGQTKEAQRLREMKEELEDYIKKTHGIFGRTRKDADSNEKTRKVVTRSISRVLEKLGKDGRDELAVYLGNQLQTGMFCSFHKDLRTDWKIFR